MKKVQHFNPIFNPKFVTFLMIENENGGNLQQDYIKLAEVSTQLLVMFANLFYFTLPEC